MTETFIHLRDSAIILFVCALLLGCSQTLESVSSLYVEPAVLDFGRVRPTDPQVRLTFDMINPTQAMVNIISISSGCGCTVVDTPQTFIPPGEKVSVTVVVNLTGRIGDFDNLVYIKTDAGQDVFVDLKGEIIDDIWYDGQTHYCSAEPGQEKVFTVLTLYTIDFPNVQFDLSKQEEGVIVSEVERICSDTETQIRFSVELDIANDADMYRTICFIPTHQDISPIYVPVNCDRIHDYSGVSQILTTQVNLNKLRVGLPVSFSVYGDIDILSVIQSAVFEQSVSDLSVFVQAQGQPITEKGEHYINFTFTVDSAPQQGFFEGSLCLTTLGNRTFRIPIRGEITSL